MRILIADEHRVFAEALASLLRMAGHEIVGSATAVDTAVRLADREQVDACVLDLAMPGIGPGLARAPRTVFVGLAATADADRISGAVASGVRGVALKTDDFVEILRVLTGACTPRAGSRAGSAVLSLSTQAAQAGLPGLGGLAARGRGYPGPDWAQLLTRREHEALLRLASGESTASMARSMGVRISTARSHVDAVLTKLNVHSRAEAVARAVRDGVVGAGWPDGRAGSADGAPRVVGD